MSGSTVLVSREIVEASGGTLASSHRFIRQELLEPLGAASFVVEPDAAGDIHWIIVHAGVCPRLDKTGTAVPGRRSLGGERLLPEGWRDYVTTYTPESGERSYGAGFWTLEHTRYTGLPSDTFFANGFQGQLIIMIPTHELVVVRLGASHGRTGAFPFVENLIEAKR